MTYSQGTLLHVAALAGNHQAARFLCGMAFSKRAAFGWTDLTPAAYITAVAEAPACSLNEGEHLLLALASYKSSATSA